MRTLLMIAGALCGVVAQAETWKFDILEHTMTSPQGETKNWGWAHNDKWKLAGTVLVGGEGLSVESIPGTWDWRHIFRNAGGITKVVFGSETAPIFKPASYILSQYAGFPGCGNITSVVCRVTEPVEWSLREHWSEGLPCVFLRHSKKLKTVELAGFLTCAVGLPDLPDGQCRVIVPENHPNWTAFAFTPGNLKTWNALSSEEQAAYWKTRPEGAEQTEMAPYGKTLKGNSIEMPAGYWLVPRARYRLTLDLPSDDCKWTVYALSPAPAADGTYAAGTAVKVTLKSPDGKEKTLEFAITSDRGVAADLKSLFRRDQAAKAKQKSFSIDIDPFGKVIKDVSKSPCFPDLGLAGENSAPGIFNDAYLSYVKYPEMTARAYREAGVWLVRPCGMLDDFRKIKQNEGRDWVIDAKGRCQWLHPKYNFGFWKTHGLKAIVCLSIWNAEKENVENLEAFLKWIVDNDFVRQVSAFEMCNEPFYGKDPEGFAAYWKKLLPIVKKYMPKTPIGLPLAEYCPGDPDIAAVKARLLGKTDLGNDYFSANNLNKWSARTVVALSNDLDKVSHIIYHVYGAAGAYGCSMTGFGRFRNFPKLFPQVKDKRWLITEWRPWSDGTEQLMRSFRETVWSGMYIQTAFCQPELDGFTLHELNSISGVLYYSANGKFNQYYDSWENGRDLRSIGPGTIDITGGGDLRYEASGMGQLFRLYNQAVITHPVILAFGSRNCGQNNQGAFWCSANYDGGRYRETADCQWTALRNASPSSICILFANGTNEELTVPVKCRGHRLLSRTHRFVTCPERYLNTRDVLGEEKMWRALNWEQVSDGNPDGSQTVTVPPRSVGTVMIGVRKWDEWHAVHYGRQLINRELELAKKSAAKDLPPVIECCGIATGKVHMVLPDGYPGHPEVKENLAARKWCEKIGKDAKLDAAAIEEAKKAGYHVVDNGKDRAWIFKAENVDAERADALREKLQAMGGF